MFDPPPGGVNVLSTKFDARKVSNLLQRNFTPPSAASSLKAVTGGSR
jgi:hypothetical protein